MTRVVLILVQLLVPIFPVGLCTCPRTERATATATAPCPCCEGNCNCGHQCSTSAKPRPRNCPDPTCPSHPSFARAEPGLPSVPTVLASPMAAPSLAEPASTDANFASRRTHD